MTNWREDWIAAEMFSFVTSARSALVSFAVLASLPAAAIAAPLPRIDDPAMINGFVTPIFDDGGGRRELYSCCHGSRDGLGTSRRLWVGRNVGARLGASVRDGTYDRGPYADEPVYRHDRLSRPRVGQLDSLEDYSDRNYGNRYDNGLY